MSELLESIAARPACPVCGMGTVTGVLERSISGMLYTVCQNSICFSTVYLDDDWKVTSWIESDRYCQFENG